jgi:electron transfer flavoprotein alpha subunit
MSILVYLDHAQGTIKPASWEVLGAARILADRSGATVIALIVAGRANDLAGEAIASGADRVMLVEGTEWESFRAGAYAIALEQAVQSSGASIVLGPATAGARDAFALAACRLGAGLAAECQALRLDGEALVAERPVYGGNMVATIRFRSTVQMATVRPRSYPLPARASGRAGMVEALAVSLPWDSGEEILGMEAAETGRLGVENASIIVSGGRGVKGPDGFEPLQELADVLGGAVGASRAAVDAGWIAYPHQVGQTGKSVRPDLYIACGISGAIQHLAGMSGSKVIVAVNKDRDAPIFSIATYGIAGDLFQVVPALTAAFKERLG